MLRELNNQDSLGIILNALLEHKDKIIHINVCFKPTPDFEYNYLDIRFTPWITEEQWKLFYGMIRENTIDLPNDLYKYYLEGNAVTREINLIQIKYLSWSLISFHKSKKL